MNEITTEIQYTKEDYANQNKFILDRQNSTGIIVEIGCIFLFLFGLLNIVISYFSLKDGQFDISLGCLVSANVCIWFSLKALTLFSKPFILWKYSRYNEKNYNPLSIAYSKRIVQYNERGILEHTFDGEFLTYWNSFSELIETETDFVFFFNERDGARFLPKRNLTHEQYLNLVELLKNKLGDKAKI
jgi:hypothetical protein